MKIQIESGLPCVTVTLTYRTQQMTLDKVLLDTGSAGTVFATDVVSAIGLIMERNDSIREIHGVGGSEFVFTKQIDALTLGNGLGVGNFEIEIGAMDYGFDIEGILGIDFLMTVQAVIDLSRLEVRPPRRQAGN